MLKTAASLFAATLALLAVACASDAPASPTPQPITPHTLTLPHSPQHTHTSHTHLSTKTTTVVRARRGGMYPRMAIHVACIPGLIQSGKGRLVPRKFNIKLKTYCNE